MKKLILATLVAISLAGCASDRPIQRAEGPTAMGSYFRQLHECIVIETYARNGRGKNTRKWERDEAPVVTILEDVKTGERFEVFGNYGLPGNRIKIGI